MYKLLYSIILIWLTQLPVNAIPGDSTQFIGRVWYIQSTGEFYTTLNFKDSIDAKRAYTNLTNNSDSVVTNEYYLTRKSINEELAGKYFDLTKFDTIAIFNQAHQKVSLATFKRVEYYEDMIDGMFIAVFEPDAINASYKNELIFYGIDKCLEPFIIEKFQHEEITKNTLDKNIRKYIEYNKDGLLKTKHLELKQSNVKKVSILSIEDLENLTFSTYLLEHQGNKIDILKKLKEDYVFWDLLPVPIYSNDKPVYIIEIIIPETDFTGYMLAVYDGNEYQLKTKMEVSK